MFRTMVRHHPSLHPTGIKWALMILSTTTVWLGLLSYQVAKGSLSAPWLMLAATWILPALYLLYGPHTTRVRSLPLSLPIASRTLWWSHLTAVMLVSGAMLLICLGLETWLVRSVSGNTNADSLETMSLAPWLGTLWRQFLAWWLLLVALIVSDRPGLATIPRTRGWIARQALLGLGCFAGLVLGGRHGGPLLATVVAVAAVILLLVTARRVPPAMSLAPRALLPARPYRACGAVTGRLPWWQRPPTWLVVLMTASKHPALLLVAAPFLVLIGLWLSRFTNTLTRGEDTGILFVTIAAYCLFAMVGSPLLRLSLLDHLALSRHRLLSCLLVPQLCLLVGGYVAGEILAERRHDPGWEPLIFSTEPDSYGLRMEPQYFAVTWSTPPTVVAPDGTEITPPDDWRPFGRSGPVLYKPFHTPLGASLEAVAWQLERASTHVFGETIPAAEFRDRYLVWDELKRVVVLRGESMELRHDHPGLEARSWPSRAALQALLAGVIFQAALVVYLRFFRPGVSEKLRKAAFVVLLVLLLTLYMSPFLLAMTVGFDPGSLLALAFIGGDWLVAHVPGGLVGIWILVIAVLALGHRLVLHGFQRAEWPLVREDDALMAVLG